MNTQQTAEQSAKTHFDLRQQSIAEVAYYKAEKRGFTPGFDWQDWVEAETDVFSQIIDRYESNAALGYSDV